MQVCDLQGWHCSMVRSSYRRQALQVKQDAQSTCYLSCIIGLRKYIKHARAAFLLRPAPGLVLKELRVRVTCALDLYNPCVQKQNVIDAIAPRISLNMEGNAHARRP
eukprot:1159659-Pelagomonas_calceolata.AAC.1